MRDLTEKHMSQYTKKVGSKLIRLLVPTVLLGLAACATPTGDNAAANDMLINYSELRLP
jgi:hypothetical protein